MQDGQLPRIFRRGRALRTQAYRREAHFTLHAMECVVGLITVRVMRERRDHAVCVGRVGSAEYPRSTVAGAPACREGIRDVSYPNAGRFLPIRIRDIQHS